MKRARRCQLLPGSVKVLLFLLPFLFTLSSCSSEKSTDVDQSKMGGMATFHLERVTELNPNDEDFIDEGIVHYQIFSRLVKLDRTLRIVPDLAEEWTIKDNGKIFIFKLKPDFLFHNGRLVNSQDVMHTFKLACKKTSSNYRLFRNYLGMIDGMEDYADGKTKNIRGVRAIDERTIQINLRERVIPFLTLLSSSELSILPYPESLAPDFWNKPIGSGPFKVDKFIPDKMLILSAFDEYKPRRAYLDTIKISLGIIPSPEKWKSVVPKDLDIVQDPPDAIEKNLETTHQRYPLRSLGQSMLFFNPSVPPFNKKAVRKAAAYALNRKNFLSKTHFEPYGIFPSGLLGFRKKQHMYNNNPLKSIQLLSDAGFKPGDPRLKIKYYDYKKYDAKTTHTVAAALDKVGFEVKINILEWEEYQRHVATKKVALFRHSIDSSFPDGDDILSAIYHSKGVFNEFNYSNKMVDQLIAKTRSEPNPEKRADIFHQVEDIIMEDCVTYPLFEWTSTYYIRKNLKGFHAKRSELQLDLKDLWWDKSSKQSSRRK